MRLAVLPLLLVAGQAACRRAGPPPELQVSAKLRAVVGEALSIDATRIDPDASLVGLKPDMTDIETMYLTLRLQEAFSVDRSTQGRRGGLR